MNFESEDMNERTKPEMESLLKRMSLIEPPESLDRTIRQLAERQSEPVASVVHTGFGWSAIISTAIAASLSGLIVGMWVTSSDWAGPFVSTRTIVSPTDNLIQSDRLKEVVQFQELHGHSSQEEFKTCSNCHIFSTKDQQVLDKWRIDDLHGNHHAFGVNCSNCHLADGEPRQPDPHQPNSHPHADQNAFGSCSDCHNFDALERQIFDLWRMEDIHEGFHPMFWQDCSLCHVDVHQEFLENLGDSKG